MINTSIIEGRLVETPTISTNENNKIFARFTLAVRRNYSKDDCADFIDCICFDKIAENLCKYMSKGDKIMVSGSLRTKNYRDKKDIYRKSTTLSVDIISYPDKMQNFENDNYENLKIPESNEKSEKTEEFCHEDKSSRKVE